MVAMLLLKRHEVNTGKQSLVSRIGSDTDHVFHAIFFQVKKGWSYVNKHTLVAIANWVAYHVLVRVRNVYVEIKSRTLANPHGKRLIDAVRGRGEVRNHSASFYLRRIGSGQPHK